MLLILLFVLVLVVARPTVVIVPMVMLENSVSKLFAMARDQIVQPAVMDMESVWMLMYASVKKDG